MSSLDRVKLSNTKAGAGKESSKNIARETPMGHTVDRGIMPCLLTPISHVYMEAIYYEVRKEQRRRDRSRGQALPGLPEEIHSQNIYAQDLFSGLPSGLARDQKLPPRD